MSGSRWHCCEGKDNANGTESNAYGDQSDAEIMQAAFHAGSVRVLDELDAVLRRGLLLVHSARADVNGVKNGEEETSSHHSGFTKQTSELDPTFAALFKKSMKPPEPPLPVEFRAAVAEDERPIHNDDVAADTVHDDCKVDSHNLVLPNLERRIPERYMTNQSNCETTETEESDMDRYYSGPTSPTSKHTPNADCDDQYEFTRKTKRTLSLKKTIDLANGSGGLTESSDSKRLSMEAIPSEGMTSQRTTSFAASEEEQVLKGSKRGACKGAMEEFLDDPDSSHLANYFNLFVSAIIHFSVILSLWQTAESPPLDMDTFAYIQISVDAFFLAEFCIRLCVCSNLKLFVTNVHNIIDFIAAVLPLSLRALLFLEHVRVEDDGIAHYIVFCLAPPLREMKILRRVQQFHLFVLVLKDIREAVQTLLILLMMMVLVFSSLLYTLEPRENIPSMPRAVWMTIVTMTTVGYGDITPESTPGHIIASILALCSVLYMAMPIGIIGNAFTQTWLDRDYILLMIKTRGAMLKQGYVAADLPAIFQYYSDPETGDVALSDFLRMVEDMNLGINSDRALKVFESIDRDGGGSIDEQEFVRAVFPSAFHDLYNKKDDTPSEDSNENSIAGIVGETLQSVGRQISPGMVAMQNMVRQYSPQGPEPPEAMQNIIKKGRETSPSATPDRA